MNRRPIAWSVAPLASVVALVALAAPVAGASHASEVHVATAADTALSENILLTPEEVQELGFDSARVEVQESAYEGLEAVEVRQQQRLRAAQAAIAPDVPPNPPLEVIPPRRGPLSGTGGVRPLVSEWPCIYNNNGYYKVTDANGKSRCWASGGRVTWNVASIWYDVKHLRPGSYKGRILWDDATGPLYWSVWRGPNSATTYSFEMPVRMWGIELK